MTKFNWRTRISSLKILFVLSLVAMSVRFFYVQVPGRQELLTSTIDLIQQELEGDADPYSNTADIPKIMLFSWSSVYSFLGKTLGALATDLAGRNKDTRKKAIEFPLENIAATINYPPKLVKMPNLIGGNMRRVLSILAKQGLRVRLEGSGKLVGQYPEPGEKVPEGTLCNLIFEAAS